jgi:D-3-phosphoglycerate dehydrogenase
VRAADTLDELLAESDVVTLHVPLVAATKGLIGYGELARLRPHAALVNASRGGVVDEDALADALSSGRLRCAATDVFSEEPPPADHPLLKLPNALCTPHMGGTTVDALRRMGWTAARAVDDVLSGRRPAHVVNDEAARSQGLNTQLEA